MSPKRILGLAIAAAAAVTTTTILEEARIGGGRSVSAVPASS